MSSANFSHSVTVLPVKDLESCIKFYKDVLGFQDEKFKNASRTEASLTRDSLVMHFRQSPELAEKLRNSQDQLEITIFITNLDEVYRESLARGARIIRPLTSEAISERSFSMEDCNGFILRFTEGIFEN